MAQARDAGGLGERPLVVLTAREFPMFFAKMRESWFEMQAELAALSSNGAHRVVEGASHVSTMTNPEHARAIVEAVREVFEAVHGRP